MGGKQVIGTVAGILYHLKNKHPTKPQDYGNIRTEIENR